MHHSPFAPLLECREQDERRGAINGLRYAEVTGVDDTGYILTWLSGSVSSQSAPARVATLMAGGERGSYFMPEVGDEVVVGFEDGNLDRPVILGALWSDVDKPPSNADTSSSNNIRTIVSRLGHQLTFDDTAGAGKVTIKSKGNLQIVMDDATQKITIEVDASNKIEISPAGVTVKGTLIKLN